MDMKKCAAIPLNMHDEICAKFKKSCQRRKMGYSPLDAENNGVYLMTSFLHNRMRK